MDSTQWDLWCVDHILPTRSDGPPPLVCNSGTFSREKHGRLFTALRGWMHQLYRQRVTRGLLKHLNSEYGTSGGASFVDEVVKLEVRGVVIEKRYRVSSWTRRSRKSGGAKKRKHGIKAANDDLAKDLKAGLDCVERAARPDWWNWSDGSRIMFWRWPRRYR